MHFVLTITWRDSAVCLALGFPEVFKKNFILQFIYKIRKIHCYLNWLNMWFCDQKVVLFSVLIKESFKTSSSLILKSQNIWWLVKRRTKGLTLSYGAEWGPTGAAHLQENVLHILWCYTWESFHAQHITPQILSNHYHYASIFFFLLYHHNPCAPLQIPHPTVSSRSPPCSAVFWWNLSWQLWVVH